MFGIGLQEMVIVGLILLAVFGPKNLPGMARDVGRFLSDARRSVEGEKPETLLSLARRLRARTLLQERRAAVRTFSKVCKLLTTSLGK